MNRNKIISVVLISAVVVSIAGLLWKQNMPNKEKTQDEIVEVAATQSVGEVVKVRKKDGKLTAVVQKGDYTTVEAKLYDENISKGTRVILKKTGDLYQVVGRIR